MPYGNTCCRDYYGGGFLDRDAVAPRKKVGVYAPLGFGISHGQGAILLRQGALAGCRTTRPLAPNYHGTQLNHLWALIAANTPKP